MFPNISENILRVPKISEVGRASMSEVDPKVFRLYMFSNMKWLIDWYRTKIVFLLHFWSNAYYICGQPLLHLWSVITFEGKAYYICGQLLHLWLLQLLVLELET